MFVILVKVFELAGELGAEDSGFIELGKRVGVFIVFVNIKDV